MPSYPTQADPGAFLETTSLYDIQSLNDDELDPKVKELIIRLYNTVNAIRLLLNIKDSGYYNQTQFVNGQVFFPDPTLSSTTTLAPVYRQVFRLVVNMGQLPNAGVITVPHGITITSGFTFTRIYGAASDTSGFNYIPIPYASPTLVNNIELSVNATNVVITTGSNRSNFNFCYVILEFIKS